MKIKKVLQGTALTALAAAAWMGAGSTDASAAINPETDIQASGNTLTITRNGNAEIMVSVVKVSSGKTPLKSWDVYDGAGDVTVDLSKLNVTKDNYVAVKTNDAEPFFLKITKTAKPAKAKYDYSKKPEEALDFGDLTKTAEYRTAFSGWQDVSGADFTQYQYQGASLYLRAKGALKNPVSASETVDDKSTKDTEAYKVYDIGSLSSKEVKLNIRKQANGPSLTGDYVKGIVKTKDTLSCRLVKDNDFYKMNLESGAVSGAGITSSSAIVKTGFKSTEVEKLLKGFNAGDKVVFEVRTDATATKPASKWARLEIDVPSLIADTSDEKVFEQSKGITTNGAIVTSGAAVKASVTFTDKGKNGAHKYTDIVIKNDGTSTIDVKVDGVTKTYTLKATKTAKITKSNGDSKKVWVRVAGDKANKKWAGAWTEVGKITFPADVAAPAK